MRFLRLPRVGSALRMPKAGGQELGVVVAVNRESRLIVALMEDGRHVELRVPAGVRLVDDDTEARRRREAN
jgi:hypothetical protein